MESFKGIFAVFLITLCTTLQVREVLGCDYSCPDLSGNNISDQDRARGRSLEYACEDESELTTVQTWKRLAGPEWRSACREKITSQGTCRGHTRREHCMDRLEDLVNEASGDCKKAFRKVDDNDDTESDKEQREADDCIRECAKALRAKEGPIRATSAAGLFCAIQVNCADE